MLPRWGSRFWLRPAILPACLSLLMIAPLHAQTSTCANTPAYSTCEMVFELGGQEHPNPYLTVDLKVEFRGPRQKTYAIPAYWDGGRRMVVRFAPTGAGDWNYLVSSNIAAWNNKEGTFTAAGSDAPGFVRPAAMHHWTYTERNIPHLWMGVTEMRFGFLDDAAFNGMADARAAQKFTHLRGMVWGGPSDPALFQAADTPNFQQFQKLDQRIRYLNQKGIVVDLMLAPDPDTIVRAFPNADQRRRFVRYVVGRYAAMNVTWQGVEHFEGNIDSRAVMKEIGSAIKDADPYEHPRTSSARITSAPLLDDGWMDYVAEGSPNDAVGAIEHQLYPVPFVHVDLGQGNVDAATLRHRLWNATMDGQYPTYSGSGSAGTRAMTAWFDFMSTTRHWELEPYFDVDGGRALALEDAEYIVYIEKPGPLELLVEKHSYDVIWMNPADGETIRDKKKFNGDHFTGPPPDASHDWVLHVVRESHLQSMNRSYYFQSRENDIRMQEIETNPEKIPYDIVQPSTDLTVGKPTAYEVKIKRATRATRSMMWLWTGEVSADRAGFRVLATDEKGSLQVPADLARNYPAIMLLRLYGMNANGKVYMLSKALGLGK